MDTGGITSRVEKGSTKRNSITSSRLGKEKKKKKKAFFTMMDIYAKNSSLLSKNVHIKTRTFVWLMIT